MSNQTEERAREIASQRANEVRAKQKVQQEDPGAGFTFKAGDKLPAGFDNPACGKPWHRCVDENGRYRPDWVSFRVHKTDSTQADRVYAHAAVIRGPNKASPIVDNFVATGIWMDGPEKVYEVVAGATRETVDMATTDADGKKLGLTGPQTVFRVIEERPQYSMEYRRSA